MELVEVFLAGVRGSPVYRFEGDPEHILVYSPLPANLSRSPVCLHRALVTLFGILTHHSLTKPMSTRSVGVALAVRRGSLAIDAYCRVGIHRSGAYAISCLGVEEAVRKIAGLVQARIVVLPYKPKYCRGRLYGSDISRYVKDKGIYSPYHGYHVYACFDYDVPPGSMLAQRLSTRAEEAYRTALKAWREVIASWRRRRRK